MKGKKARGSNTLLFFMISCGKTHYFNSGMKAGVLQFCFLKKILVYLM